VTWLPRPGALWRGIALRQQAGRLDRDVSWGDWRIFRGQKVCERDARSRWQLRGRLNETHTMYQVTFSEQAMGELNRLPKLVQLDVVDPITSLKPADLAHPREPLGFFRRGPKAFFRLRAGDFRFYFEALGETLHVDYILHKNSLEDFLLRNKLPVSEQQLVEQHSKFWKYLESLTK
jgi:mRNA-degrading endonuclease RelE of RelBE toxin-antitoxin system